MREVFEKPLKLHVSTYMRVFRNVYYNDTSLYKIADVGLFVLINERILKESAGFGLAQW